MSENFENTQDTKSMESVVVNKKHGKKKCDRYITSRGYVIRKKFLTPRRESNLRKELCVAPFEAQSYALSKFGPLPRKFAIYMENREKYYVPRFWGIHNFGLPEMNELTDNSKSIDIHFNGNLRESQQQIMNEFIPKVQSMGGSILNLGCAQGKTVMALYLIT